MTGPEPTTVVITMAGRGQRFRNAGYDVPKFTIEVHGRTLFAWSLASLSSWSAAGARFVFVVRREDDVTTFVTEQCRTLGITSFDVLELDGTTDGQATTVMAAGPLITDTGAALLIYNIDTHVRPGALDARRVRGDGWLPCFPGLGPAWSFVRARVDGRVVEVREKQRISADATVGLYWFRSFDCYRDVYEGSWREAGSQAAERYVAPLYNVLVTAGAQVFVERLPADAVVPLGTPAEVAAFASGPAPAWAPAGRAP